MREGAQREPRMSYIAVFQKGWPLKKAALYVYMEANPAIGEQALADASQAANRHWQQSRLSTTGALQEATGAGIQELVRRGQGKFGDLGISCAVLQPEGVYLAQAGAIRAYVLGPQVCRRVAPASPWDPNQVDVREELLPANGALLMAPSVLEGALPLLQGGLPPREIQRLIRAWLQDRPNLSALVLAQHDGDEVALGVGAQVVGDEEEEPTEAVVPEGRPAAVRIARTSRPEELAEELPAESPFPLLRALRLPLLVVAALLAVFILGGLALYIPSRQKGQDETRLVALLEKASQLRQEGRQYSDPPLARGSLNQADGLAREAAGIRATDKRVVSLKQDIEDDLDRVNSVVRPSLVTMLADMSKEGGAQSNPSRVVVDGNNLYILDKGAGRVYKYLLDSSGTSLLSAPNRVLVRKGDIYGGYPLADFLDITYLPSGPLRATGSLLMLDSQGTLVEYRPDKGTQILPLRGFRDWASFRASRGFNGNLYVLDAGGNQVWRYIPTSTGYDSEPRGILDDVQIGDAIDLAIDGNIYSVTSKGTVWLFAGAVPKAFGQDKMDRPIVSPAAVFATPATRYVYVADKGNGRIVAFTKEGEFRFQIRADALDGVQGVFVDEDRGILYFVSGQKAFVASLTIPPARP